LEEEVVANPFLIVGENVHKGALNVVRATLNFNLLFKQHPDS